MSRISRILHHRSLTVSVAGLFFALLAFSFFPEHAYRLHRWGRVFLVQCGIAAALGLLYSMFTLIVLLRDDRSGYPSFRCSLAILLWALASIPSLLLAVFVVGEVCR